MVVSLGPGKFYGTSLPRPRFYTDVKFNDHRVDPPVSVVDPLLSWAEEAHWSMGGLSFKRLRLQGRIEGNVKKLRSEHEKTIKKRDSAAEVAAGLIDDSDDEMEPMEVSSPSPPPAPIATKRKRFMADLETEIPKKGGKTGGRGKKKKNMPVRKLDDEFDRVAAAAKSPSDAPAIIASRTRSGRTPETGKVAAVEEVSTQIPKKRKLRRLGEIEKAKRDAADRGSMTPTGKSVSPSSITPTRSSPRQPKPSSQ